MYQRKALTDDEKYMQNQLQLERELAHLQREYLIADKDYQRSIHAKGRTLLKTTKVIDLYSKEYENILKDLSRAKAPGQLLDNQRNFDALGEQLERLGQIEASVEAHKEYIEEIQGQIKIVKKSVQNLESLQVSDKERERRAKEATKTVETLENKLEIQMIKFGTICSKNKELRIEIDHLLADRRIFMKQWNRLIKKLAEGKQIMMDLIEQATIAFNQREEWCNKLQILRTRAHRDLVTNRQEMLELKRHENNRAKLEQFFSIKGQKRIMKDLEEKVKEKRRKRRQMLEDKLETYQKMLVEIQEFSNETEARNIAKNFTQQDEINISTFRYIIDTIREIEMTGDDLGYLRLDIEESFALNETRDEQQKSKLAELEEKYEDTKAEATAAKRDLDEDDNHYQNLLKGVDSLFKLCKCDKDPILQLLGDNNSVHFYNVNFYLKLLEGKVHQFLIAAGYKAMSDKKQYDKGESLISSQKIAPKIYSIEKVVETTPCSLCVEHEMVSDIVDVLQHVVTKDKARHMLKHSLKLPGGYARLHKISDCQLPKSRKMIQKRYE